MLTALGGVAAENYSLRTLSGKRLGLHPYVAGAELDALPEVFDQAFPQWCKYFGLKESDHADWRMTGCLMEDEARFVRAGLMPKELPPFEHGFSWNDALWIRRQPSDYYSRHLLLHEGTHGLMNTLLGGCGPTWYMEGMAEYLGTHRWRDGRLELGYMPKSRDEAPGWGRVRLIQDAVAQHKTLRLPEVIELNPVGRRENEFYAWCWAAVFLLDRDPRFQERFRQLIPLVQRPDFNQQFRRLFESDWDQLCRQWQIMTVDLEYGYDPVRCAVDFAPGSYSPRPAEGKTIRIDAARGWQNTGLRLEAGASYRITASGRYQVANPFSPRPLAGEGPGGRASEDPGKPKIWWGEPGGVSIRYYRGQPLGVLLAAVLPDRTGPDGDAAPSRPSVVGLDATLAPERTGTLFLKINESAGELSDNAGELRVEVRREK